MKLSIRTRRARIARAQRQRIAAEKAALRAQVYGTARHF